MSYFKVVKSKTMRRGLLAVAALCLAASIPTRAAVSPGFLKFEYWTGMDNGTAVSLLTDYIAAGNKPSIVSYTPSLDSRPVFPDDSHEQYGAQITGFLTPTESGSYTFFLRSDDASELWLSTDNTPANVQKIAEQTGCCNAFTEPDPANPGTPAYTSAPIALTAGKSYYIQLLYKEGGGGDYGQVAWRKAGDTTPAGSLTPIPAAFLSTDADPTGETLNITSQPQSQTVTENSSATFTVAATATTPYKAYPGGTIAPVYIWTENGVVIPTATGPTLTIPIVNKTKDNNAKIKVVVALPGLTQTSSEATLTVTSDTTPPTIVSATGNASLSAVALNFDGPVDPTTAQVIANYSISPTLAITKAVVQNNSTVVLTTAAQTPGTKYTVTVNGIKDLSGNVIAASTTKDFYSAVFATGSCVQNYYANVTGGIAGLTNNVRFPNNPDFTTLLTDWEYPPYNGPWLPPASGNNEAGDNYGNTITGWFIPPKTGNYVFFTCSDDPSNLYLSTDDSPANKKLIAQETAWANPRQWVTSGGGSDVTVKRSDQNAGTEWPGGTTITLTAGKKYYLESQHTEGGGGDNVEATFIMAGDPDPTDGDPSKLTGAVIGTTISANGFLISTSPGNADTSADASGRVSVTYNVGLNQFNPSTVALKVDQTAVTPTLSTNGSVVTVSYQAPQIFAAGSKHTADFVYPLADGSKATNSWAFTVANYFTVTPDMQVKPDPTKPGFIWNYSQVADIGTNVQNSLSRTELQLAGLLGPNIADPSVAGAASGAGTAGKDATAPISFVITNVINLSISASDPSAPQNNGNFTPDLQMPGAPGTAGGNDNQAAEILTFIDLPAGLIRMGVNSDDDFATYVGQIGSITNLLGSFGGNGRGASDTIFTFVVQQAGTYAFRTIWENGGGGSNIEWFTVNNGKDVLLNDTANGGYKTYRSATANPVVGGSDIKLTATVSGANLTIAWSPAGGTLQSATALTGSAADWTDVGTTNPTTTPIGKIGNKFFRVKK